MDGENRPREKPVRPCFLILNPTSGQFRKSVVERVASVLSASGLEPKLLLTEGPNDPRRLAREICERHEMPLIAACGGDGTINAVVNGLVPGRALLGVLPLGTSNVLAKELGIVSIDDAVRRLVRGEARQLPVGLLEQEGEARRFLLMAGIGFDGAVVEQVRPFEKRLFKQGAYLLSALRRLADWERGMLEVEADGRSLRCHSVIICNGPRYGGPFILAPEADLFAPRLQALCITAADRSAYLRLLTRTVRGKTREIDGVATFSADRFTVRGEKPVQVDGDFCGRSPVTISCLPDFVRLIV